MNAILAAFVNGILVSAPLTLTVWIALRLTRRRWLNAATRYAIWWAVLMVTVALPFSYLPYAHPPPRIAFVPAPARAVSTTVVHDDGGAVPMASVPRPSQVSPRSLFSTAFPIRIAGDLWPPRILFGWLLASALMLLRLLMSAILMERRKSTALDLPWRAADHFRVASSDQVSIPLVAGPWRRTILLPTRLLHELHAVELEQIVIHETAHLTRCDDYALLVQRLIEAALALHPVVWLISANIDLEREIACDDKVIAATGNPIAYASCLARVVELSGGLRALPMAAAAAGDRSHLARRVQTLLDEGRHAGTCLLGLRLVVAVTGLAVLAWGASRAPGAFAFSQSISRTQSQATLPTKAETPSANVIAQVVPPTRPAAPARIANGLPNNPPTVFIPVEVRDPLNRYVTGLDQKDFKVQEDGVDQAITQFFTSEDPVDIVVMSDPQLSATDLRFQLMSQPFNKSNGGAVRMVTLSQRPLLDTIRSTRFESLAEDTNRKAIFIVTSGKNNQASYTDAELADALRGVNIPIYVVELVESPTALASGTLLQLASRTGGLHVKVERPEDLVGGMKTALTALGYLYFIGYTPRNSARDGSYRALSVTLAAPRGLPPLTARSRAGYTAPAQ